MKKIYFENDFKMDLPKPQQPKRKSRFFRKFVFFYLILNLIAYSSFLLNFTPKIEGEKKDSYFDSYDNTRTKTNTTTYDYILTPDYNILGRCSSCNLKESENFYPFHKFNFAFGSGGYDNYSHNYYRNSTEGYVGIFGFYGHLEFFFYVLMPFIIFGLTTVYKKFVR